MAERAMPAQRGHGCPFRQNSKRESPSGWAAGLSGPGVGMSNQRDCARLEGQKLGENAFEWNQQLAGEFLESAARTSEQCHLAFPVTGRLFVSSRHMILRANSGSRGTRADQGVCPARSVEFAVWAKLSGIAHEGVRHGNTVSNAANYARSSTRPWAKPLRPPAPLTARFHSAWMPAPGTPPGIPPRPRSPGPRRKPGRAGC